MKRSIAGIAGVVGMFGAVQGACAQETITLRMAGFLPPSHYMVTEGSQVFMDEVTRLTGGRVEWQYFPAEQLGKATEMLNMAQLGVADVLEVAPSYETAKWPLSGVLEMPGNAYTSCEAAVAFRALGDPGGIIHDSEYAPSGVRVLTYETMPPYSVHSRVEITSPEAFTGKKLRPAGAGMELSVSALDAVGVKVPSGEIYEAAARGTVDAVMTSFAAAKAYGLRDVAKHAFTGYPFGQGSVFFSISEKKFQALPEDVQSALVEAGKVAEQNLCRYMDDLEATEMAGARDEGVAIYQATDTDRQAMDKTLESVGIDWAASVDAQGKPGTATLEAYRAALAAGK